MNKDLQTLLGIMLFYSFITFFFFPYLGFYLYKMSGLMYGMVMGAVVSILLWKYYGSKMVRGA